MNAFADKTTNAINKNTVTVSKASFFSLTDPLVLSGMFIGAMMPFLFGALTMLSVGKAAQGIIKEVRDQLQRTEADNVARKQGTFSGADMRYLAQESEHEGWNIDNWDTYQFKDKIPGGETSRTPEEHMKRFNEVTPEYDLVVENCTKESLKEMLMPGALAIMTPLAVGLLVGAKCLGGLLMGAIGSGFLLAVMMNNAGGAWDNSKKYVENEEPVLRLGKNKWEKIRKKHDIHKAVVTGDTVGDPFKDTSGPALNILIKLMSVLSLTCGGIFRDDWDTWWIGLIFFVIEAVVCGAIHYYMNMEPEEEYDEKYLYETGADGVSRPKNTMEMTAVAPAASAPAESTPAASAPATSAPATKEEPAPVPKEEPAKKEEATPTEEPAKEEKPADEAKTDDVTVEEK